MGGSPSTAYTTFLKDIEHIDTSYFQNDKERHNALEAARALCMRLSTSMDHMVYMSMIVPATQMAQRTVLNMGVFHKLADAAGAPQTTAQLAEAVGADPVLLSRLLKQLAASRMVVETDADTWNANQYTHDVTNRNVGSGMDFLYELVLPCFSKGPEYLASTGYQNPTSTSDGIWQYATDSPGKPFFSYLYERPQVSKNFMELMSGWTFRKQKWIDYYPAKDLFSGDRGGPLIVDVGGGIGSDLTIFLQAYPEAGGRLILQDQPGIIENFKKKNTESIEAMVHDFLTPQPIKGARAYLLHAVFHDWSDEECGAILKQLKHAMIPGYSKILSIDCVIPPRGAHVDATTLDMIMLGMTGAWERTEQQWSALYKAAGFKIVKIHYGRLEAVIEADLE